MADQNELGIGKIGWVDLTVADAGNIRDFYQAVVGWTSSPISMGSYDDYCMMPPGSTEAAAGICHASGENAGLPAVWLICITVADVDSSARECEARGGKLLKPIRSLGDYGRFCVIQDPAGAVAALIQKP
jgi:uncharacterized protein